MVLMCLQSHGASSGGQHKGSVLGFRVYIYLFRVFDPPMGNGAASVH